MICALWTYLWSLKLFKQLEYLRIFAETPKFLHLHTHAEEKYAHICRNSRKFSFAYISRNSALCLEWTYAEKFCIAITVLSIYTHGSNMEFLRICAGFLSYLILEFLRTYREKFHTANTVLRIDAQDSHLEFLHIYTELFTFWLSLLILEFLQMYAEKLIITISFAHIRTLKGFGGLRICTASGAQKSNIISHDTQIIQYCSFCDHTQTLRTWMKYYLKVAE